MVAIHGNSKNEEAIGRSRALCLFALCHTPASSSSVAHKPSVQLLVRPAGLSAVPDVRERCVDLFHGSEAYRVGLTRAVTPSRLRCLCSYGPSACNSWPLAVFSSWDERLQ